MDNIKKQVGRLQEMWNRLGWCYCRESEKQLVIARFKENVDWLSDIRMDKVIYNMFFFEPVYIGDVGWDAYAVAYHLSSNYYYLAPYTIFLQANPFKQSVPGLIKKINSSYLRKGYHPLGKKYDHHLISPVEFESQVTERLHRFCREFELEIPGRFDFGQACMFSVDWETVHRRPKSFYDHLVEYIIRNENDRCPMWVGDSGAMSSPFTAHVLERMWWRIFS